MMDFFAYVYELAGTGCSPVVRFGMFLNPNRVAGNLVSGCQFRHTAVGGICCCLLSAVAGGGTTVPV